MEKEIEVFITALGDLVQADGNWQEKKRAINAYIEGNDRAITNLEEFLGWFDQSEE